ncbi:hypothetical protein [Marinomonas posidonica]|uniref:hypothetical protein n=1 Tax=Marinomonas posidonica TaxID=936476 RepID=UPI0037355901
MILSPLVGGAGIVVFVSMHNNLLKTGTLIEMQTFFVLLYMVSIMAEIIYFIPMLVLSILCVNLRLVGNVKTYLWTAFFGGIIAHYWWMILLSGDSLIIEGGKSFLSQTYFFIVGFLSTLLMSWLAFPKIKGNG